MLPLYRQESLFKQYGRKTMAQWMIKSGNLLNLIYADDKFGNLYSENYVRQLQQEYENSRDAHESRNE